MGPSVPWLALGVPSLPWRWPWGSPPYLGAGPGGPLRALALALGVPSLSTLALALWVPSLPWRWPWGSGLAVGWLGRFALSLEKSRIFGVPF